MSLPMSDLVVVNGTPCAPAKSRCESVNIVQCSKAQAPVLEGAGHDGTRTGRRVSLARIGDDRPLEQTRPDELEVVARER